MTTQSTIGDVARQRCEVWTRVMGYHRPVAQYNPGKKSEHAERRFFALPSPLPGHLNTRFSVTV
jgi:hypothetical protein